MMRVPEHPTQIRRMLNARLTRLGGSEPILAASLAEVQRRCGQPSCRCGKGGPLHTSHQLTFKNQGKTKTVSWIDNHKRLKTLLSEIHQLTVALVKTHASHTSRKAGRV
jgi:hypothetical protein